METPAPRTLVYQMGRVGSISWFSVARELCGVSAALHVHYMAPSSLDLLRTLLAADGPGQTMVRRQFLRGFLRQADEAATASAGNRDVTVIAGMRDPVARALSVFFFMADFFGCSSEALSWRDGAEPGFVIVRFQELLERATFGGDADDTFGQMCLFMMRGSTDWFDDELRATFGVDVRALGLPPGPIPRMVSCDHGRLLMYRTEDMKPGSAGNTVLRRDAARLLGPGFVELPLTNDAAARRSRPLFEAVHAGLRLPRRLLDLIYGDDIVRLFYTDQEIAGFHKRWLIGV